MNKTKPISTEAGDVVVLHKVLTLDLECVFLFPVAVDRKNFICATVNRDDVRQGDLILVLIARQVVVDLNLVDLIAVVVRQRVALLISFLLLNICVHLRRLTQLDVSVEPSHLQFLQVVLGLAHHVRHTLCRTRPT